MKKENKDYILLKTANDQETSISFKRKNKEATKQESEDRLKDEQQIFTSTGEKLFITKEAVFINQKNMQMEVYTMNNAFVAIELSYPRENSKAKEQLFDI